MCGKIAQGRSLRYGVEISVTLRSFQLASFLPNESWKLYRDPVNGCRVFGGKFSEQLRDGSVHSCLLCYCLKWSTWRGELQGREGETPTLLLFSRQVVSDSLWPRGLQHTRLPCPSLSPGVCSNSMSIKLVTPSNHLILCHPLLVFPQSFPASGSLIMSQLFASGDQRIGGSASASVLPMNFRDWFPLGLTGLISL